MRFTYVDWPISPKDDPLRVTVFETVPGARVTAIRSYRLYDGMELNELAHRIASICVKHNASPLIEQLGYGLVLTRAVEETLGKWSPNNIIARLRQL